MKSYGSIIKGDGTVPGDGRAHLEKRQPKDADGAVPQRGKRCRERSSNAGGMIARSRGRKVIAYVRSFPPF